MNSSMLLFFFGVYVLDFIYGFSLNPAGYSGNGDPAPGRSPGPPIFNELSNIDSELDSLYSKCHLNGTVKQQEQEVVNLTLSHKLFKTDVLVPGISYQVIIKKDLATSIDFTITSSIDGDLSGEFSSLQDCGPHIIKSRLSSESLQLNWTFQLNKEFNKSSVTFQLEYSSDRDPFVYRLIYVLPITQECQLQLTRDEADLTHHDIPHTSAECQVWFPSQRSDGHGLVIELTRLNVPCSRGFVHFSGLNMTQHPQTDNTLVHFKSHKQTHLCGKLEELPEADRHVYFPASSSLSSSALSHTRPAMHLQGQPVFSISYHLVDYCYNVSFFTRNGSFELKPKGELQCTFKIHLPYGNRVALKLWIGDSEATGSTETAVNFQDFRNGQEECDGLLIQLQDGTSFWAHCTKLGDGQRQIEIVSRENKAILNVRIRTSTAKSGNFGLKLSYRAEPVESVVGVCDFGWVLLRQFCIGAMEGLKLPWSQAEIECTRKGGHLVSIRSDRDQQVIDNLLINR